jgi:hypothetical protein
MTGSRDNICPHCGKPALVRDFLSAKLKCQACFISGIERPAQAPEPPKRDGIDLQTAQSQKEAMQTNAEQVVDGYVGDNSEERYIIYGIRKSDDRYIPDLTLEINRAEFHRWRLRKLAEMERRWGRDDMRERGFQVAKKVRESGRLLKVLVRENEYVEGTGQLAVHDALWVSKKHYRQPLPPEPEPLTEQDLIDYTREVEHYLEELRRGRGETSGAS